MNFLMFNFIQKFSKNQIKIFFVKILLPSSHIYTLFGILCGRNKGFVMTDTNIYLVFAKSPAFVLLFCDMKRGLL